jgi:hypothetical protein
MNSSEKKHSSICTLLVIVARLSVMLCAIYIFSEWSTQPMIKQPVKKFDHSRSGLFFLKNHNEANSDEQRIARHFTMDTLPGLMQCGLVKRYERRETGTLLLVSGKIWKERSRFFKESLLTEMLVFNQVNGYATGIHVIDYSSNRLYANALSLDRKEFFD